MRKAANKVKNAFLMILLEVSLCLKAIYMQYEIARTKNVLALVILLTPDRRCTLWICAFRITHEYIKKEIFS